MHPADTDTPLAAALAQVEALRSQNKLLLSTLDAASDGILARLADGTLISNSRAAQLWGIAPKRRPAWTPSRWRPSSSRA